jgi:hypothetical protein
VWKSSFYSQKTSSAAQYAWHSKRMARLSRRPIRRGPRIDIRPLLLAIPCRIPGRPTERLYGSCSKLPSAARSAAVGNETAAVAAPPCGSSHLLLNRSCRIPHDVRGAEPRESRPAPGVAATGQLPQLDLDAESRFVTTPGAQSLAPQSVRIASHAAAQSGEPKRFLWASALSGAGPRLTLALKPHWRRLCES